MNLREAKDKASKVKWKTDVCFTGEDCWCRIIVPEEPIKYDYHDGEETYEIVSAGSINKEFAEQIVREHNMVIDYITPNNLD